GATRRIQITTNRLATTWVRAGTRQVPEAQRCHERTRPAARSTGRTHAPYTVTWTVANSTAEPMIADPAPFAANTPKTRRRKNASSATAARMLSTTSRPATGAPLGPPNRRPRANAATPITSTGPTSLGAGLVPGHATPTRSRERKRTTTTVTGWVAWASRRGRAVRTAHPAATATRASRGRTRATVIAGPRTRRRR